MQDTQTGSLKNAGFSLFRRNRLVVQMMKNIAPKRYLDNRTPSNIREYLGILLRWSWFYTKDDINFGEYEEEFLEKLREAVNSDPIPLIKQARIIDQRS